MPFETEGGVIIYAFATGHDLIERFDIRLIGDLITDAGETLPADDIPEHPNLLSALKDASGEMVVALRVGGRYTEKQLEDLTKYAAAHRTRVCCDIAMALLIKRRPIVEESKAAEVAKQSREHLRNLADGKNIFGFDETVDAGLLELATPSTVDITDLNLLPERMNRFFPDTFQRMPRGRN